MASRGSNEQMEDSTTASEARMEAVAATEADQELIDPMAEIPQEALDVDDFEVDAQKRNFFAEFLNCVHAEIVSKQDEQPFLNDAQVHLADGNFRLPSLLLASVSPVFRVAAPLADIVECPSLVLPDLTLAEFELFVNHLCELKDQEAEISKDDESVLDRVMDVLCLPFQGAENQDLQLNPLFLLEGELPADVVNTKGPKLQTADENKENDKPAKRKPGRKRGARTPIKQEPYVKTEVTDYFRTSNFYSLRASIKRKKFTDEISEPSDLDLDEEDDDNLGDSSDEYNPEDGDQKLFEEESETDEDFDENEEDFDEEALDDQAVADSDLDLGDDEDDIIDMSVGAAGGGVKRSKSSKDIMSFAVRVLSDGSIEVLSPEEQAKLEAGDNIEEKSTPRPRGRPKKKVKTDESEAAVVGIGRVVSIMEDDDSAELGFKSKNIYAAVKSNPKSLLKSSTTSADSSEKQPLPLILFCSVCERQCNSQAELKIHAAKEHKGSKFFKLPPGHPHRDSVQCSVMLKSYENLVATIGDGEPDFNVKDICFPCPHCRRRYVGHLGSLANHLMNDHRNVVVSTDLGNKSEDYYHVLKRDDPAATTCDFCAKKFTNTMSLNKHLIICSANDSGYSAGLYCHICGKMFAQQKYLKDHVARHGKDLVNRPRNYLCPQCPVTCISEANLAKHLEREHSTRDHDDGFVLHEGCLRCEAMWSSYMENKANAAHGSGAGAIPFREMVFKCPHCCMVLYANHKHAPRYLANHIHKFHMDAEINDLTLGGKDPSEFRLRSKLDNDTLTCEFCSFTSKTRANHNVHLSTCKQSTVPCRPGYMCDTCGFIAGTAVHLRNHLESHNDPRTYACNQCDYTGRSKRYLKIHIKNHHSADGQRRKLETAYVSCPKCGKLKKDGATIKVHMKKCGKGPPRVPCPECDMEFKRREDMQAHALIHYGQVVCPIHNILFKKESEVFQHVNVADPGDKYPKLQCCMCDNSFRHMCIFMKHMRRHLRIAPYRCQQCHKHMNTYASLAMHTRRVHGNEKLPPKEKIHKCETCSKTFANKGHLNEHIQGVHGNTVTNCPVCHKSFNTQKRMKKHLFNSHKESADEYRAAWRVANEPFTAMTIKI